MKNRLLVVTSILALSAGLVSAEEVRVYNSNNELIGEGDPMVNPVLGMLVNRADLLSEMGGQKYYRVSQ